MTVTVSNMSQSFLINFYMHVGSSIPKSSGIRMSAEEGGRPYPVLLDAAQHFVPLENLQDSLHLHAVKET